MSDQQLRQELYASYANRAMIYYRIFEELRNEFGAGKAEELLSRAIYRRGRDIGQAKFAAFGPNNLDGLQNAFLGGIPDHGEMFKPEVLRSDADGLDIKFHGCPLRDTWLQAGLDPEEVAVLCRIAAKIDDGTFEAAGFAFHADTWQPEGDGCCCLHIRPGRPGTPQAKA